MNLDLYYKGCRPYLVSKKRLYKGIQYIFKFENQYGASVIKHAFSSGHEYDLWELAVIKFDNTGCWDIDLKTHIADDVIGFLNDKDVVDLLKQIKELK